MRAVNLLNLLVAAGLLAGCSLMVDDDTAQCSDSADCAESVTGLAGLTCVDQVCVQMGGDVDMTVTDMMVSEPDMMVSEPDMMVEPDMMMADPWACVGVSQAPELSNEMITLKLPVTNLTMQPLEGVMASACDNLDVNCDNPFDQATTDAEGIATFSVPGRFDGYIQLDDPTLVPSLIAVSARDVTFSDPEGLNAPVVQIPTPMEFRGLIALATGGMIMADLENRGQVLIRIDSCPGDEGTSAGVQLSLAQADGETVPYYFQNNLPVPNAEASDDSGNAGFINTPTGILTVTSREANTERILGVTAFLARPGWLTYVRHLPSFEGE